MDQAKKHNVSGDKTEIAEASISCATSLRELRDIPTIPLFLVTKFPPVSVLCFLTRVLDNQNLQVTAITQRTK
jgi:hypothetical protein